MCRHREMTQEEIRHEALAFIDSLVTSVIAAHNDRELSRTEMELSVSVLLTTGQKALDHILEFSDTPDALRGEAGRHYVAGLLKHWHVIHARLHGISLQ